MEVGITGFFDSGPVMDTVQIELVKLRPQLAAFLFKAGDYRITERLHFWKRAKLKDFSLRAAVKMSLMFWQIDSKAGWIKNCGERFCFVGRMTFARCTVINL